MRKLPERKIKVLFDFQIFVIQKYGGIPFYIFELFRHLNELSADARIVCLFSKNEYLNAFRKKSTSFLAQATIFKASVRYINILATWVMLKVLKPDIFHPTFYHPYFTFFKKKHTKVVLTVHDMISEIYSRLYARTNVTSERKARLLPQVDAIIANSNNTKRDIIKWMSVPEEKIHVVHLAVSVNPAFKEIELPEKFILYVGGRSAYKNFDVFLSAIAPVLLDKARDLFLVCVGSEEFLPKERAHFTALGVEARVIQKDLSDEERNTAYKKAICFVYPSLYEGFGLSILESFACQCPAVISSTHAFPEVGGSAAEYFDPSQEASIKHAVLKVLDDESLRETMKAKGIEQLKHFSLQKTAAETLNVYKKVLSH